METSQGPIEHVLARLRAAETDLAFIEVKKAAGGLPKDVWPTVSAFSNGSGGSSSSDWTRRTGSLRRRVSTLPPSATP